MMTTLLGALSL